MLFNVCFRPLLLMIIQSWFLYSNSWWHSFFQSGAIKHFGHNGHFVFMFVSCIKWKKVAVSQSLHTDLNFESADVFHVSSEHFSHVVHVSHLAFGDTATFSPLPSMKTSLRYFVCKLKMYILLHVTPIVFVTALK